MRPSTRGLSPQPHSGRHASGPARDFTTLAPTSRAFTPALRFERVVLLVLHHLIEVHCFSRTGERGTPLTGFEKYNDEEAPCVCASQSRADGTHGILHAVQGQMEAAHNNGPTLQSWPGAGAKRKGSDDRLPAEAKWTYKDAREAGALAHKTAFPHCNAVCISNQLDDYHKNKCGLSDDTPLRSDPGSAKRSCGTLNAQQQQAVTQAVTDKKGIGSAHL